MTDPDTTASEPAAWRALADRAPDPRFAVSAQTEEHIAELRAALRAAADDRERLARELRNWQATAHAEAGLRDEAEARERTARAEADALRTCTGCGAPRLTALLAVLAGKVACCPECSTLTMAERNAMRAALAAPADAEGRDA